MHTISDISDRFINDAIVLDTCYYVCLSLTHYKRSVRYLCKGGSQMYTKKRMMKMYQFDGTIGASRYPKFRNFLSGEKKLRN